MSSINGAGGPGLPPNAYVVDGDESRGSAASNGRTVAVAPPASLVRDTASREAFSSSHAPSSAGLPAPHVVTPTPPQPVASAALSGSSSPLSDAISARAPETRAVPLSHVGATVNVDVHETSADGTDRTIDSPGPDEDEIQHNEYDDFVETLDDEAPFDPGQNLAALDQMRGQLHAIAEESHCSDAQAALQLVEDIIGDPKLRQCFGPRDIALILINDLSIDANDLRKIRNLAGSDHDARDLIGRSFPLFDRWSAAQEDDPDRETSALLRACVCTLLDIDEALFEAAENTVGRGQITQVHELSAFVRLYRAGHDLLAAMRGKADIPADDLSNKRRKPNPE